MSRVFIMAYARKNLGDDLFIKMLLDKYNNHNFFIKVEDYEFMSDLDKYDNLNVIIGKDTDEELYKMDVNEYDAYVYIGGSIFMEGGKVYNLSEKFYDFVKRCEENKKPFCYVSCNYGPYQTQEYFQLSKKNFMTCTDICFRDKYSYNLFQESDRVRYAPDFAFRYDMKKSEKIKDSIGISIIDFSIRANLTAKEQDYIEMLVNNIKRYIQNGKKVYLYTFCNYEKDERTLDIILDKFKGNPNLIGVRYRGDIDEFMDLYSRMEYSICSRFHAIILSCLAKQNMFVLSYSKKIDNVIDDLDLRLPIMHFEDVTADYKINLDEFVSIDDKKLEDIINQAEGQEEAIRRI